LEITSEATRYVPKLECRKGKGGRRKQKVKKEEPAMVYKAKPQGLKFTGQSFKPE